MHGKANQIDLFKPANSYAFYESLITVHREY